MVFLALTLALLGVDFVANQLLTLLLVLLDLELRPHELRESLSTQCLKSLDFVPL